MSHSRTAIARIALAAAAAAVAIVTSAGSAAGGVSYGSVTKFSTGSGDSTAPVPGSYRADWATASTPAATGDAPHVPFGLGKMLAKAQSAMAMFANGTAEKHYIGTTKERVDNVALQTADITDCSARTLTHLDLAKKTYSVTSLDQPVTPSAPSENRHAERPGPAPSDDGTKVAMAITTRALGAMTIEGVPTTGYDTNIKMTATKPTGESASSNMAITAYYAAMDEPHFGCSHVGFGSSPPGAAAAMANYALAMRALRTAKGDPRFTITSAGPPLPASRFAMWQTTTMAAPSKGHETGGGFSITQERGDLHSPVSDNDAVFGIPAGFTKVDG